MGLFIPLETLTHHVEGAERMAVQVWGCAKGQTAGHNVLSLVKSPFPSVFITFLFKKM